MQCPTVKVKCQPVPGNEAGEMIINQADYDANPGKYELVGETAPAPAPDGHEPAAEPKAKRVKRVG